MSSKPPEPEIRQPLTRRQMLERIALALTATGVAPFELAWGKHVHRAAREEKEKTGALPTPSCSNPTSTRPLGDWPS